MTHPILRVLNSTPIDRQARRVTSQRRCADIDLGASREDLVFSMSRMQRKMSLMKLILRVKTPAQHDNLKDRYQAGAKRFHGASRRLMKEYLDVGQTIHRLGARIGELNGAKDLAGREARQRLGAIENAWRAEHPGCIWDGRQLVAPNGEVFSRAAAALEVA